MALSGTITKNVGSYWRLRLYWTATQDEANNRSTITSRLYWETVRDGVGAVYSSSSKSGSQKIHTSSSGFTSTAGLSAGQSKLLDTHVVTVTHSDNGSLSVGLSASFDVEVSLSGTYYGTVSLSGTATLDTIARKSTLAVSASWTAGDDKTFSINRSSSAFRHELEIYATNRAGTNVHIKQVAFTAGDTSQSSAFSDADLQQLYDVLDTRTSCPSYMVLQTYNGSTHIGSNYYDGTITAETASYPANPTTFNIGDTFRVDAKWYNSKFVHTVRLKNGSTILKSYSNVGDYVNFTTSDIKDDLYGATPTSNSLALTIEVLTYMGTELVRASRTGTITAKVTNSNPTFPTTGLTYKDNLSTSVAITGNDQYIVSGVSSVLATLASTGKATAINGATIKSYIATLGGKTITIANSSPTANLAFLFGQITASTNQTLVMKAVDSRNNSTSITKTVLVVPYTPPIITASATRVNGFEASTTIKLSATFSPVSVGGVNKNAMVTARYRTKESKTTTWSAYTTIVMTGFPKAVGTDQTITLNNLKSYEIEFEVSDKFKPTVGLKTVATGQPLFFLDDLLSSVGIGDFPKNPNEVMINKRVRFGGNMYVNNGAVGEGVAGGAMDLANSDIVGLNGLWFNDRADTTGEGLFFLNTGATNNSASYLDYTQFYLRDNYMYINQEYVMRMIPGDANGNGVALGGGGLTVVGSGESALNFVNGYAAAGFGGGTEQLWLTSDAHVNIKVGMQDGYSTGFTWMFYSNGNLVPPHANAVEMNQYGNLVMPSRVTSATWNVIDAAGRTKLSVPMGSANSVRQAITLGENFEFYSDLGPSGDTGSNSAIVFRNYSSTNKEFILVDEGTNGFVFNADQGLPAAGGIGTGNGNLYAAKYNVVSDENLKEEIVEFSETALQKIKGVKTYNYKHIKSDERRAKMQARATTEKPSLGLLAQEAPSEITTNNGLGIDIYAMNTLMWKAIQELAGQVEYLEKKLRKK